MNVEFNNYPTMEVLTIDKIRIFGIEKTCPVLSTCDLEFTKFYINGYEIEMKSVDKSEEHQIVLNLKYLNLKMSESFEITWNDVPETNGLTRIDCSPDYSMNWITLYDCVNNRKCSFEFNTLKNGYPRCYIPVRIGGYTITNSSSIDDIDKKQSFDLVAFDDFNILGKKINNLKVKVSYGLIDNRTDRRLTRIQVNLTIKYYF
jgi:hypothetical protein